MLDRSNEKSPGRMQADLDLEQGSHTLHLSSEASKNTDQDPLRRPQSLREATEPGITKNGNSLPGDGNSQRLSPSEPKAPSKPWEEHLDDRHDIQTFELRVGSSQWESVPFPEVQDRLTLPETVRTRLYLVEGLAPETPSAFPAVGEEFFRKHYAKVLPYDRSAFGRHLFFGKWTRRVHLKSKVWNIETRIAQGRPFSGHVITTDPQKIKQDHDRYEAAQRAYRPYSSLAAGANLGDGSVRQAVDECVSICFQQADNGLIGVLIFDAPRKVRVTHKKYKRGKELKGNQGSPNPKNVERESSKDKIGSRSFPEAEKMVNCFLDFKPTRKRFIEQLDYSENFAAFEEDTACNVRSIILRFILDDHMEVMSDFRDSLDFVDEKMSDDEVLGNSLHDWRNLFGQWKRNLSNDLSSIAYISKLLGHAPNRRLQGDGVIEDLTLKRTDRTNSLLRPPVLSDFDTLAQDTRDLIDRAGSTFQAMTATMAIVESQKAIAQAKTISKLTNLAFFFIPLTLCASVLGMNIKEWEDRLSTRTWILVFTVVILLTYSALYLGEIKTALSRGPDQLRALNVNSTAKFINHSSLFFIYYCRRILAFVFSFKGLIMIGILALTIGWAVGIWAIATRIPLTYGSKVSVGVGFAIGVPFMLVSWAIIWVDDDDSNPKVGKTGWIGLVCLPGPVAVSIWAVFRYASIPYTEKITVAVGLGVGIPILYTFWVGVKQDRFWSDLYGPIIWTVVLLVALAPSLWAIITWSALDLSAKVSLSVGLGIGLPCLVPFVAWFTS